jgi:hypothetical protein
VVVENSIKSNVTLGTQVAGYETSAFLACAKFRFYFSNGVFLCNTVAARPRMAFKAYTLTPRETSIFLQRLLHNAPNTYLRLRDAEYVSLERPRKGLSIIATVTPVHLCAQPGRKCCATSRLNRSHVEIAGHKYSVSLLKSAKTLLSSTRSPYTGDV